VRLVKISFVRYIDMKLKTVRVGRSGSTERSENVKAIEKFIYAIRGHALCRKIGLAQGQCMLDPECWDKVMDGTEIPLPDHCTYCGKQL